MLLWDKKLDQWVFLLNKKTCKEYDESECEINMRYYVFIFQRDYLKIAQQFFQLVGGSASECGTVKNNVINMVI